jgi:hypothetical protein
MTTAAIALAFLKVAELGIAIGAHPLTKHDGCWTYRLTTAPAWAFAVNGHAEPQPNPFFDGLDGTEPIAPYHCFVQFNGWPFAILGPHGGFIASGAAANEESLIAAIEAEIAGLPQAVAS